MDSQATLQAAGSLKEPTLKDLLNLVRVTDLFRLGLELNVDSHDIQLVQQNHPTDHQKQLLDIYEVTPTDCHLVQRESPSLTRRHIHKERHSGPVNGQKTTTDTGNLTPQLGCCSLKVLLVCSVLVAGAIVVTVMFVRDEQFHPMSPVRDIPQKTPTSPDPVTKSSPMNTKPVHPTLTPGEYEDWLPKEPTVKFLSLITYTDSKGKKKSFRLISEVQNNCQDLGTELGIDPPILKGLQNSHGTPSDICRDILQTWIDRGVQVTWERLLQGLHDIQLGRIEKGLREALSHSPEINNAE
ncbi:hypothetical protein GBAR_LOCUS11649 [Geodia barretti]|uniref:Death domain-containing protein n=1 Tax=Geodia barretti TaxID=519541 RepID=A0AA35RY99_GEOBA|nr:hypothetical protein GBAR_LOCUS11649 [Geodia barretti]